MENTTTAREKLLFNNRRKIYAVRYNNVCIALAIMSMFTLPFVILGVHDKSWYREIVLILMFFASAYGSYYFGKKAERMLNAFLD